MYLSCSPRITLFQVRAITLQICYKKDCHDLNLFFFFWQPSKIWILKSASCHYCDLRPATNNEMHANRCRWQKSDRGSTWVIVELFHRFYTHPWSVIAWAIVKKAEMTAPCTKALLDNQKKRIRHRSNHEILLYNDKTHWYQSSASISSQKSWKPFELINRRNNHVLLDHLVPRETR